MRKRSDKPAPGGKLPEPQLLPGFTRNPGRCPDEARGKRVRVQLWHGSEPRVYAADLDPMVKPGWEANATRWQESGRYPFHIFAYRVIE